MTILSSLKLPRPGQLLALVALALLLGLLVFAALPDGKANMLVTAYKAWTIGVFLVLGLVADMVVYHYARPGAFKANADCTLCIHCMYRRAIIIGSVVLAGGIAL